MLLSPACFLRFNCFASAVATTALPRRVQLLIDAQRYDAAADECAALQGAFAGKPFADAHTGVVLGTVVKRVNRPAVQLWSRSICLQAHYKNQALKQNYQFFLLHLIHLSKSSNHQRAPTASCSSDASTTPNKC
jgi:hypothetical protein